MLFLLTLEFPPDFDPLEGEIVAACSAAMDPEECSTDAAGESAVTVRRVSPSSVEVESCVRGSCETLQLTFRESDPDTQRGRAIGLAAAALSRRQAESQRKPQTEQPDESPGQAGEDEAPPSEGSWNLVSSASLIGEVGAGVNSLRGGAAAQIALGLGHRRAARFSLSGFFEAGFTLSPEVEDLHAEWLQLRQGALLRHHFQSGLFWGIAAGGQFSRVRLVVPAGSGFAEEVQTRSAWTPVAWADFGWRLGRLGSGWWRLLGRAGASGGTGTDVVVAGSGRGNDPDFNWFGGLGAEARFF